MDDEIPARSRHWLQIGWPSFLLAGVQEALVFAVVDPSSLTWFGTRAIDWPVQAVYTVSFFIFWIVIAVACTLCLALAPQPRISSWSQPPGRAVARRQ